LRLFGRGADPESAYRAAFPDASDEALFEYVQSDWFFRMPAIHLAQAQAAGGGRAHFYELTFPAPVFGGALGACHAVDVALTFGQYAGLAAEVFRLEPTPEVEALSARIRSAWTDFAAESDPGWPAYDPEQRLVQIFDTEPAVTPYPEEVSRLLWQDHVFDTLPLLTR
jgi:para-nitrobenzyl esterase